MNKSDNNTQFYAIKLTIIICVYDLFLRLPCGWDLAAGLAACCCLSPHGSGQTVPRGLAARSQLQHF